MPKVYSSTSQVSSINEKIMQYIKGKKSLPNGAKIRKLYATGENTHIPSQRYAGSIEYSKVLPNGNVQSRLVTAYGDGSVGMTTKVSSPSGELLKAYTGVRERAWKAVDPKTEEALKESQGTVRYFSGNAVDVKNEVIKNEGWMSPEYYFMANRYH